MPRGSKPTSPAMEPSRSPALLTSHLAHAISKYLAIQLSKTAPSILSAVSTNFLVEKLAGSSAEDPKIATMMDDYTGADNDTFMTEMIEDYGSKGLSS